MEEGIFPKTRRQPKRQKRIKGKRLDEEAVNSKSAQSSVDPENRQFLLFANSRF